MGNICFCCKEEKKLKEYQNESLIVNKYCYKCRQTYISNNEYNKHIIKCNQIFGDI